jgi:hypothetical protein
MAAAVVPFVRTDTQRQKRPTVAPEEMAPYIKHVTEQFRAGDVFTISCCDSTAPPLPLRGGPRPMKRFVVTAVS